ncbi:MAG: hypothetical protein F6K30_18860 [Cyanothece sp. SIO2G6]|nr:hypothetical protein [Cyanothece sp. SIO2G6]
MMNSQRQDNLFTALSPQAASQTQGGNWATRPYTATTTVVRFRYYPGSSSSSVPSTINITNPEFEDGSIVNFGGDNINVSNPEVDDEAVLTF